MPDRLVALFGPTGVGKTAVAIAVARRLQARGEDPVAISADALQVYRGLETLTGAPNAAERRELEHRLVGFMPVTETFSVGAFMQLAHREIDRALHAGRRPIVVGGTGLYLRTALSELSLPPAPPDELRTRLEERARSEGAPALHSELTELAPETAATIAPTDRTRVVRALELLEMGEGPEARGESELWTEDTRLPTLLCGLTRERDELYKRIDARVDAMVAAGAGEEARRADSAGASRTARAALGFEELLAGDVAAMKRRTRNYARRQLTWMRKLPGVHLIQLTARDADAAAVEIERLLAE